MYKIRVLIVDDEPLARGKIKDLLRRREDVDIVGEAGSGPEAVKAIKELSPNLVFLDVQMPGLDGFEVLKRLNRDTLPGIIFVTAYDKYALEAFEVHALDYLLKPYSRSRFFAALDRASENLRHSEAGLTKSLKALVEDLKSERTSIKRIAVKSAGRMFFVKTDEIDWISAADNYVMLHVGEKEHLVRETMTGMEKKLDPERFIRIHRSAIVNVDVIKEIQPWSKHDHLVILKNQTRLTLSRKYKANLKEFF